MNLNDCPVERYQFFILMSPGISTPVIRVRKTTDARFVSIINCRSPHPGHLDNDCFPEYSLVDSFFGGLRPQSIGSADFPVRPRQKREWS